MLEICLYLGNLKTYETVVYLCMKYNTRMDLRNEMFILNIGEEIAIKINQSRCWKSVYISAILKHMKLLFISV